MIGGAQRPKFSKSFLVSGEVWVLFVLLVEGITAGIIFALRHLHAVHLPRDEMMGGECDGVASSVHGGVPFSPVRSCHLSTGEFLFPL